MAPRTMTDLEIMQKFLETSEIVSELRIATARIEEKVDTLVNAQSRCGEHDDRLRAVEVTTGRLNQNFNAGAWIAAFFITAVGALASFATWFKGH